MKFLQGLAAAVLAASVFSGCASLEETPLVIAPPRPMCEAMQKRGAALAEAMDQSAVRGVVISGRALPYYEKSIPELARQIRALGMNRVYVDIESPEFFSDDREDLWEELCIAGAKVGVRCEAMLRQENFFVRYPGDSRWHGGDGRYLNDTLEEVVDFNDDLPGNAKLTGVTVVSGIHLVTRGSGPKIPMNTLYLWNEQYYGKDSDNNVLMSRWLDQLAAIRRLLGAGLPLTVGIPGFYHDRAVAGDLSRGTVLDFLQAADRVLVWGEGEKPSEFAASFQSELKAASKAHPGKIILGLNLASHISGRKNALRRRDWADFVKITRYLVKRSGQYPAYGGLVYAPWRNLELLWEQ